MSRIGTVGRRLLSARVVEAASVRGLVAPCAGGWHLWRSHPGYRRACRMLRRTRARWVAQDFRHVARVCQIEASFLGATP